MIEYDVVVIGGGPAGMAAAIESAKTGAKTLIIERDFRLGGILNQCIHNGFGLHYFKEELTGPEYAEKFVKLLENTNVEVWLNSFATKIDDKKVSVVNEKGCFDVSAKSIVLAMGCREKTAGEIKLNGSRPAGIMTAGQVQKLVNYHGKLPGKKVVILGSGDIGLIMARRLTYIGAKVEMVLEIMPTSGGLPRNIRQCLEDYNIPLLYNTTITEVTGKDRVEGIRYATVDENFQIIKDSEKYIDCDLVVLSVGLIPDREIAGNLPLNPTTNNFSVNEYRECSNGIFVCGNVLHVHDLVDNVTKESYIAGYFAGLNSKGMLKKTTEKKLITGSNIRYSLPNSFYLGSGKLDIYFRVKDKINDCKIVVKCKNEIVYTRNAISLKPSEMETIQIDKDEITDDIEISVEARK